MGQKKHTVRTKCRFCNNQFDSFGLSKVCPSCDANMEAYFRRIKAFINDYPDATIAEIHEELGLPTALIKYFLKEERLMIKNQGNNFFLKCEMCHRPISSGRYCFECEIVAVRSEMTGTYNEENAKMEREIQSFQERNHAWRGKKHR